MTIPLITIDSFGGSIETAPLFKETTLELPDLPPLDVITRFETLMGEAPNLADPVVSAATPTAPKVEPDLENVPLPVAVESDVAVPTQPTASTPVAVPSHEPIIDEHASVTVQPHNVVEAEVMPPVQQPVNTLPAPTVDAPIATKQEPVLVQHAETARVPERNTPVSPTTVAREPGDVAHVPQPQRPDVTNVSEASEVDVVREEEITALPTAQPHVPVDVAVPHENFSVSAVDSVRAAFAASRIESLPPPEQVLLEATAAVADTMLVSPDLIRTGSGEIRVTLKPDVLVGSEVVFKVEADQVSISFAVPAIAEEISTPASYAPEREAPRVAPIATEKVAAPVQPHVAHVALADTPKPVSVNQSYTVTAPDISATMPRDTGVIRTATVLQSAEVPHIAPADVPSAAPADVPSAAPAAVSPAAPASVLRAAPVEVAAMPAEREVLKMENPPLVSTPLQTTSASPNQPVTVVELLAAKLPELHARIAELIPNKTVSVHVKGTSKNDRA